MCPNKNSFVSYKHVSSIQVLLGNNLSCEIIGISDVQLQVSDDNIKTLTNVRHIPCLKRNLIFINMLNEFGMIS